MAFDPRTFAQQLVYEELAPAVALLQDLASIQDFDRAQEVRSRRCRRQFFWSFLPLFVAVVLWLSSVGDEPYYPVVLGCLGALLLLTIFLFFRMRAAKRLDLENRRYELAAAVLQLLRVDMDRERPVSLRLDLGASDRSELVGNKFKNPRGWKVTEYICPWLSCTGQLLDDTRFELTATRREQHCVRWKTNARGKSKRKSKIKVRDSLRLRIRPGAELLPHLRYADATLENALQLPPYVRVRRMGATSKGLGIEVAIDSLWQVERGVGEGRELCGKHAVAMMFLNLYNVLNRARGAATALPLAR